MTRKLGWFLWPELLLHLPLPQVWLLLYSPAIQMRSVSYHFALCALTLSYFVCVIFPCACFNWSVFIILLEIHDWAQMDVSSSENRLNIDRVRVCMYVCVCRRVFVYVHAHVHILSIALICFIHTTCLSVRYLNWKFPKWKVLNCVQKSLIYNGCANKLKLK